MADPDDGSSLVDRLADRLARLRDQLTATHTEVENAVRDSSEAAAETRVSLERIATLGQLLAASRAQEERLTTQTIRDQETIEELRTRNGELAEMAARVAEFERDRAAADARSVHAENRIARVQLELSTVRDELQRAQTRVEELTSDLSAAAVEVAAGERARATARRLAMERDEARERAQEERRMAAADRIRADEMERRIAELEAREEPAAVIELDTEGPIPERPAFPLLERDRGPWFMDQPSDVVDLSDPDTEDDAEREPLVPKDPGSWL